MFLDVIYMSQSCDEVAIKFTFTLEVPILYQNSYALIYEKGLSIYNNWRQSVITLKQEKAGAELYLIVCLQDIQQLQVVAREWPKVPQLS